MRTLTRAASSPENAPSAFLLPWTSRLVREVASA